MDSSDESPMANPQDQSPFFNRLPGELRNYIYELAMRSRNPIIDAYFSSKTDQNPPNTVDFQTRYHHVPQLSAQLLRTCRRMYLEVAMTNLYARNRFRFTTSFSAQRFLSALPEQYRDMLEDFEVDLFEVSDAHPAVEREWVQYLDWKPNRQSLWALKVGGLHDAAPNLRTLRLNVECWQVRETMRSVALLKELLRGPRDLQRIVMTGKDGSEYVFGSRTEYLYKWGPVALVGLMRYARLAGMIDWMAQCVAGDSQNKVVAWSKRGRQVNIEIMTAKEFHRATGTKASMLQLHPNFDPAGGACLLEAYEQRWKPGEWPSPH